MAVLQQKAEILSGSDAGWQLPCEERAALRMVLQAAQTTPKVGSRSWSVRGSLPGLQEEDHLSGPGEIPRTLKHVARSAPLLEGHTTTGILYKEVT